MLVPANAFAGAERLANLWLGNHHGVERLEEAGKEDGTRLVGEDRGLLRCQRVGVGRGVVIDVAGRRLRWQPLANKALGGAGPRRQLGGRKRSRFGDSPVEPELVAKQHERGIGGGAEVIDHLPQEHVELGLIDWCCGDHCGILLDSWSRTVAGSVRSAMTGLDGCLNPPFGD